MAHRLHEDEGAVEHGRHHAGEDELRGREARPRRRRRVVRQDEGEGDERGQDRKRGARTLELEALLEMPRPAPQQAHADKAVADDHDGRKHRVAREARGLRAAAEHDRDDERHLDHGHGDGEHEGAERLADPMGDDLGVIHRREHRRREQQRRRAREHAPHLHECCRDEERAGKRRPCPSPPGHAICRSCRHEENLSRDGGEANGRSCRAKRAAPSRARAAPPTSPGGRGRDGAQAPPG